jgi:hypothetical protein
MTNSPQVGPIEAALEHEAAGNAQLEDDVILDARRGGGSQRDQGHCRMGQVVVVVVVVRGSSR